MRTFWSNVRKLTISFLDARSELINFYIMKHLMKTVYSTYKCKGAQSVCLHFGKKNRRVENSFLPFFSK